MIDRDPARYRKAADKLAALRSAAGNPTLRRDRTTVTSADADDTTTTRVTDVPAELGALITATAGNRTLLTYVEQQLRRTADLLDHWNGRIGQEAIDSDGALLTVANSFLPTRRSSKSAA
ncbi:hypothetical protein [Curtobacterium sp. MCBD17_040]|uniref:hypothetical protein n=1 Tax=Curtobacterium sp. MCBD17_040 TaxID=2175674 RepID=UPI000DA9EF66|nr:hypothetical protein [Curtobacterium sp. MCBD17_040]WIB65485.1 hypothetical protein DEI94_19115 [Curtobacterium sp. MCBD17_040]